jgi:hypothetical protein
VAVASVHQDRQSFPVQYLIVLADHDTLVSSSITPAIDRMISSVGLSEVEVTFKSGETLELKYYEGLIRSMRVFSVMKECVVPENVIPTMDLYPIDLSKIRLAWDGDFKHAFEARYFGIQFEVAHRSGQVRHIFFLRNCARIGSWEVLEEMIFNGGMRK